MQILVLSTQGMLMQIQLECYSFMKYFHGVSFTHKPTGMKYIFKIIIHSSLVFCVNENIENLSKNYIFVFFHI